MKSSIPLSSLVAIQNPHKFLIIFSSNLSTGAFLVLQADIDNSGTIDYGEFLAATVHLNKLEREENLVSAFSFFDKDGSGYITIDELQQACKEFGLSELHLDDMIKEIDQDNVSVLLPLRNSTGFVISVLNRVKMRCINH